MVNTKTFRYLLANKIAGHKLPVIRSTTAQLVGLLTNPQSDLKSIAHAVLRDQSLTTRVLSIANSAYYRRQGEKVISISQAVLQLGRMPLRDIAIASEFVEFSEKNAPNGPSLRRLLAKSFVAAHQALALGRVVEMPDAEALFTSTLLNSLGELTLASFLPTVSQQIDETACAQKLSYDEAHFQVTGMRPYEVTMIVAARIKIPEELILPPPDWEALAKWTVADQRRAIVHLANAWAASLLIIRECEDFDHLMAKTAQAFSLPGATVANALTEGFHNALDAGASINLDADAFALVAPSSGSTERGHLIQSCARPIGASMPPNPSVISAPREALPRDRGGRKEAGLSAFSRLVLAFRRLLS
jgi:HD-like signal output (HDOD) protein